MGLFPLNKLYPSSSMFQACFASHQVSVIAALWSPTTCARRSVSRTLRVSGLWLTLLHALLTTDLLPGSPVFPIAVISALHHAAFGLPCLHQRPLLISNFLFIKIRKWGKWFWLKSDLADLCGKPIHLLKLVNCILFLIYNYDISVNMNHVMSLCVSNRIGLKMWYLKLAQQMKSETSK